MSVALLRRMFRLAVDYYLALPAGVIVALVWAQAHAESYFRFSHATSFAVNEVGMATTPSSASGGRLFRAASASGYRLPAR